MKKLIHILSALLLTSCAYTYDLSKPSQSASNIEATTIKFSNTIKVSSIDSQPFKPKFSVWVYGSHQITLPPGIHTFRFRYNAVSMNGGAYTNEDTILSKYLEAGKNYEIDSKFSGGRIRFMIIEEGKTDW